VVDAKLPNTLLKLWAESKTGVYKSTGKQFKKAYVPFVTRLSNMLIDQAPKIPMIAKCLAGIDVLFIGSIDEPMWLAYQNGDLKATNINENKTLGGGVGKDSSKEEEDRFGDELRSDQKAENADNENVGEIKTSEEIEEKEEVNVVLPTKEEKLEKQRLKEVLKEGTEEEEKREDIQEVSGGMEEKKLEVVEEKEPEMVEEKKEEVEPKIFATVLLEEPVLTEYASNNYWRPQLLADIKELEADF